MFLLFILLLVEIPLAIWSVRRSGFLAFPHLLLFYVIGCEISIFLVANDYLTYEFLKTYSNFGFRRYYTESQMMFAFIFGGSFLAFRPAPNLTFVDDVRNSLFRGVTTSAISIIVIGIYIYHFVFFLVLDWSVVWQNSRYLAMSEADVLRSKDGLSSLLLSIFPLVGMISFAFAAIFAGRRNSYVSLALTPVALFDLAYQAAAHSRKAVLFLLVFAVISFLLRKNRISRSLAIATAVPMLMYCLGGRQLSMHGFSSFPYALTSIQYYIDHYPSEGILNIFEGSFSTTELFVKHRDVPSLYAILSFSPFPSFIDGFDSIRVGSEQRLGLYAPPPAILEAWTFGTPYLVFLIVVEVIAGRLALSVLKRRGTPLAIAINMLMAFAMYLQFTYPIRMVFRFFLIVIAAALYLRVSEIVVRDDRRVPKRANASRSPSSIRAKVARDS